MGDGSAFKRAYSAHSVKLVYQHQNHLNLHSVLHRRTVRFGGPCEDPAALCLRQRGHCVCRVCVCGIYQKPAGCRVGGGGAAGRDAGVGKKRGCRCNGGLMSADWFGSLYGLRSLRVGWGAPFYSFLYSLNKIFL